MQLPDPLLQALVFDPTDTRLSIRPDHHFPHGFHSAELSIFQ